MQWPNTRDSHVVAFDRDFSEDYFNYLSGEEKAPVHLAAHPSICTVAPGRSTASTALVWTAENFDAPSVFVSESNPAVPRLFASGRSGTSSATWIGTGSYLFQLTAGGAFSLDSVLAETRVYGIPLRGKLASSSPDNTCRLGEGQSTCTLSLYWSVPDVGDRVVSVYVYRGLEKPSSGFGILHAQSGSSGESSIPWVVEDSDIFNLVVDGQVLDTLTVTAVR